MGDYFRFGSVFIKKSNQTEIFFFEKKNRNRVKLTSSNRFWLGFLCFGSVFSGFGSVFFGLARFFWFGSVFPVWLGFGSVWLGFFPVFCRFRFGSVRFFWFFVYKTETEPAGFFKNLIGLVGFFFRFGFFGCFFSGFLGLIGFLVFLLTPNRYQAFSVAAFTALFVEFFFPSPSSF
jgi:hypothetical protein